MWHKNRLRKGQINLLTLKNKLVGIIIFAFLSLYTVTCYASELEEADSASFSSDLAIQKIYDHMSEDDGVTYIYYDLGGASNNINNVSYITSQQKYAGLREPYKFGYKFDGWYLDKHYSKKADIIYYTKNKGCVVYAKWIRTINNEYSVKHYEYTAKKDSGTIFLKDCDYDFIDEINIPGMPETKEQDFLNNYIFSESQCPQGICITDDYVLITSYSDTKNTLGELMVFDRKSGDYLVTLGMDSNSHLGGIAFDGQNVWVCNSYTNTLERISYDFIDLMATANSKQVIDATGVVDIFKIDNKPSCITYYGGRLWVATHTLLFDSKMLAYHYSEKNDELTALSSYKIPSKVQGVTFDENGKVYLSTSYGRNSSSYLKCYRSLIALSSRPNQPDIKVEMPPGSEELDSVDDCLYIIFESAGEKYLEGTDGKGSSISPIDKILCVNTDSFG